MRAKTKVPMNTNRSTGMFALFFGFTGAVLMAEEKPEATLAGGKEIVRQPAVAGGSACGGRQDRQRTNYIVSLEPFAIAGSFSIFSFQSSVSAEVP
jgi:hypothetical protein